MGKRYNREPSESQSNAEALERRERTYSEASGVSFRIQWDWHNREPKDLREAVRMIRAAYADEVPARLHNRDLADDGTPHMTPQAEGYIFGSADAGTAPRVAGEPPPVFDFYRTPCRAAIAVLRQHSARWAELISAVAVGEHRPVDSAVMAAISVGVPRDFAYEVADATIRAFLRNLTDVKVHLPAESGAA